MYDGSTRATDTVVSPRILACGLTHTNSDAIDMLPGGALASISNSTSNISVCTRPVMNAVQCRWSTPRTDVISVNVTLLHCDGCGLYVIAGADIVEPFGSPPLNI